MSEAPSQALTSKDYLSLCQNHKVMCQYVWLGGTGMDIRCKTRTLSKYPSSLSDIPLWNYDGSSTGQAPGDNSEVWLKPIKMVRDPFRLGNNIIVLCETLNPKNMSPIPTNRRSNALKIFNNPKVKQQECWYGIEQEYTMFYNDGHTPYGWPKNGFPGPQGPYYCSVGAGRTFGREVVEEHYKVCLYAGINISGCNAEVMPGQWEYQVGPCLGIDAGDSLILSRFFLERVAEKYGIIISFDPKPIPGDWNGAGCHTNFSTLDMRKKCYDRSGYKLIVDTMNKFAVRKDLHMAVYGSGNERRLTGLHETQSMHKFTYGVADRGSSIRIPRQTFIDGYGYLEDRRPASNMDPYDVTSIIAETCVLYELTNEDKQKLKGMKLTNVNLSKL